MKLRLFIATALLTILFASCDKTPKPLPHVPYETIGVFVLNNGNYGSNDASLTSYEPASKAVVPGVFQARNGKKLGDTAQDILVYGGKIYVSVFNSGVIFVTDLQGTIIKEIKEEGKSPRHLASYNGNVFVTFYEGEVGKIDTTALNVISTVKVGDNPEELKAANGKLYVANSGGLNYPNYDNRVSVVNPVSMSVVKTLEVVENPCYVEVNSKGDVYVISIGNYADIPATLQKIDSQSDVVAPISDVSATYMSMGADDKLYIISSTYDENWNQTFDFFLYNTTTMAKEGSYIKDGTVVANAYSITADPVSGNIYVGASDYVSNGDMYVFTEEGTLYDKFDTGGLNPITVGFVLNK